MKQTNISKAVTFIVYGGLIAAVYVALTVIFVPISFGPIQFRISELLCILPFFTPAAIPGLFIGCLLGNIFGGAILWDIIFGSLATLIGALGSYLIRKHKWAVCVPPILANTLIVPFVLSYAYQVPDSLPFLFATVAIGEILAIGVLGNLLLAALSRNAAISRILRGSFLYG